jgi:hypothetical protein
MFILVALFVAVCGTLSTAVRSWVGAPLFWGCVLVTLITLYGMAA